MTFCQNFATDLLETHLGLISKKKTNFVSNKTLFYSIRYVNATLLNKATVHIIAPHIEILLFQYMAPLFALSPKEFYEFENDYNEYLQKEIETSQNNTYKQAASDLLIDLLKFRKNDRSIQGDYIVNFLSMLHQELVDDSKRNKKEDEFIQKESILYIIQ